MLKSHAHTHTYACTRTHTPRENLLLEAKRVLTTHMYLVLKVRVESSLLYCSTVYGKIVVINMSCFF